MNNSNDPHTMSSDICNIDVLKWKKNIQMMSLDTIRKNHLELLKRNNELENQVKKLEEENFKLKLV